MTEKKRDLPTSVTFEGHNLEAIRTLVEARAGYIGTINNHRVYDNLQRLVSPPLDVCGITRDTLVACAALLGGVESVPSVESVEYDEFTGPLNEAITRGQEAFENRPLACEMQDTGDDNFACRRCFFDVKLDVWY